MLLKTLPALAFALLLVQAPEVAKPWFSSVFPPEEYRSRRARARGPQGRRLDLPGPDAAGEDDGATGDARVGRVGTRREPASAQAVLAL